MRSVLIALVSSLLAQPSQFAAILTLRPGDLAATKLHDRCQRYLAEPPPADWDGAWQMDSK